jgi:hypothetical protein
VDLGGLPSQTAIPFLEELKNNAGEIGDQGRHYMKSEFMKSHDELRAMLRLAGIEVRKRSIGRRDSPLLP